MDILKNRYTITELSEQLGLTDHTLRFYEKEFNLNIPKDERGRRYYNQEMANILYQIKIMREEGLEIKAIRKILLSQGIVEEPPPVMIEQNEISSIVPVGADSKDITVFFSNFKQQLTTEISCEINSSMEKLSQELFKTKLELGACVENSARKIESKLEKHFYEVDRLLGNWREKKKKSMFLKLFKK